MRRYQLESGAHRELSVLSMATGQHDRPAGLRLSLNRPLRETDASSSSSSAGPSSACVPAQIQPPALIRDPRLSGLRTAPSPVRGPGSVTTLHSDRRVESSREPENQIIDMRRSKDIKATRCTLSLTCTVHGNVRSRTL